MHNTMTYFVTACRELCISEMINFSVPFAADFFPGRGALSNSPFIRTISLFSRVNKLRYSSGLAVRCEVVICPRRLYFHIAADLGGQSGHRMGWLVHGEFVVG